MESLNDSADIFANSSAETVAENSAYTITDKKVEQNQRRAFDDMSNRKNGFNGNKKEVWDMGRLRSPLCASSPLGSSDWEDSSLLSSRFVSELCQPPVRLYCPFCPLDYGFEFLLRDHVRGVHSAQLRAVATAQPGTAPFYPCPFCHAKFNLRELLPRHLTKKHPDNLADLCALRSGHDLECAFCRHRVQGKHRKLLAVHVEKKHWADFEAMIYEEYCSEGRGRAPSEDELASWCPDGMTLATQLHPEQSPRRLLIRPILKTPTSKHSCSSEVELSPVLPETDTRYGVDARRKLRFDLPDSPSDGAKLKSAFGKKNRSKWKFLKKDKKNKDEEHCSPKKKQTPGKENKSPQKTDEEEPPPVMRFRCGLCLEGFRDNLGLVEHSEMCRKSSLLGLKAKYRCAQCHAKFYRNSFLVRHSARHHPSRIKATPLCLKAKRLSIN